MIQQKVVELRTEMNSRDQLVLDLRRQLTSQKQVGAHVVELREKLARSKANHQRVSFIIFSNRGCHLNKEPPLRQRGQKNSHGL